MSLKSDGLNRLVYQYGDSQSVKNLLAALLDEYNLIDTEFANLRERLDIDLSNGQQLELIGEIVGQSRPAIRVGEDDAFTFAGAGGKGFSSLEQPETGGEFVSISTVFDELQPVPDSDYRRVLKAAIVANYATSDVDDIIRFCDEALGIAPSVTNDVGHVTLTFSRTLLQFEVRILNDNLPIPAGVGLSLVS